MESKKIEERNLAIINALPDTIYVISSDGVFLDYKAGDDKDVFTLPEDIIGRNIEKVFSTELADQYHYYIQQALSADYLQVCEYKMMVKDYEQEYEARFVGCGKNEALVMVRNITQRKKTEAQLVNMMVQLEESHDNLNSILNQLRLGSAMVGKDGKLTFISQAGLKFLGLDESAVGEVWQDVLPLSDQEKEQIKRMCDLSPKKRLKIPVNIKTSDRDDWIDVEIQDHPQDSHKKIFLFYDVTEVHTLRRMLDEKNEFQGLVGQSRIMKQVYQQIRELSDVDVSVLIQGETGTGKELVARALHNLSSRKDKPFIAVNCGGLTSGSLLSSQLFGHRRGAFTGAVQDQKGFLEAADGGTLFLDEVGDIPPDVQTSLLRFLQDKEVIRIGESKGRKIDVRILAATQHELMEEVTKGRFRMDLYYRIHVATVSLPPLRDRREDIPLLVAFFLDRSRELTKKNVQQLSNEAMQILVRHDFSGNVRELQGVIEAAVIRCSGTAIEASDLPEEICKGVSIYSPENERQKIEIALEQTRGNRSAAARLLGMSRATFYRRLESLGLVDSI